MNDCVVLAAPGGNPAPVAALVWALARQRGLRATRVSLVLYDSAQRYLGQELLGSAEPLTQLREVLGDPELAALELRTVTLASGEPLEEDLDPAACLAFAEVLWQAARSLQASTDLPVVFALLGGRRRSLTVDMALAFQLLARPQDLLLDLRYRPKDAERPTTRFFFPEQTTAARVPSGRGGPCLEAHQVELGLVDVPAPRLRRLLGDESLASFTGAIQAGEQAALTGPAPRLEIHILQREVWLGQARVRCSRDQIVWLVHLASARLAPGGEGWVPVDDTSGLAKILDHCLDIWKCPPNELSDGYDLGPHADAERPQRLRPIRSRLRAALRRGLAGHPHRDLVVPEQRKLGGCSRERLLIPANHLHIVPPIQAPDNEP